ncbi:uncharacterized protein [Watersipora subatra]|uniref:uncharacterized protein n=1 Tax=Watersipora subatra TaxID=2589382 RepID=UPI00355B9BFC
MNRVAIFFGSLMLFGSVASHSWIACTDYLQENGDYWSENNCRAFPRGGHHFTPKNEFGKDTGFDYHPSDPKPCRSIGNIDKYTDDYGSAYYYPGQKVVIAHPTKNHVAEECTNQYIPDNGSYIFRSERNPSTDPTLPEFHANKVADLGISPFGHDKTFEQITTYPKPGFQNAPKFCENNDKALATAAFYIPPDLQAGKYIFMWSWSFNSDKDVYTTCWEAQVMKNKAARNRKLTKAGLSTDEPELLYGISLAPLPDGVDPPTAGPTSAAPPPTIPSEPTPDPNTNSPPVVTQSPTCQNCVPSTLTCLDNCLKSCY